MLRAHVTDAGDELVGEYVDDGHSGAWLDRPALDALRDAAEGGLFQTVWCLSPDRLARAYAYQVLVLDELSRFGVTVRFTDSPGLAPDDPQATLLTQVQGVIAEYEKAKIAERYRRGKLFRARAGEVTTWKTSYGYRRVARSAATGPAHLQIYEPEAAVVRRIFTDRAGGTTVREICRGLNADQVPSPTGKATWGTSTILRLLRNEAYIVGSTSTAPNRCPTGDPTAAPAKSPATAPTGSRSPVHVSSPTRRSRPPGGSRSTTPNGAHAGPNRDGGYSRAWSNAVPAGWAPTVTRCAAVTAPGTTTTTAATTTHSAPAAKIAAAPNATSAPTPSMSSSSTRSASRSPNRICC